METPGLLEKILLELHIQDLLFAQKISRFWRELINTSPDLQRALFFKPASEGPMSWVYPVVPGMWNTADCTSTYNRRDRGSCVGHIPNDDLDHAQEVWDGHWGFRHDDFGQYRVFVNPFISTKLQFLHPECESLDVSDQSTAVRYEKASWRSMLFAQPTISRIPIDVGCSHWHIVQASGLTTGITLEKLHSAAFGYRLIHSVAGGDMLEAWVSGRDLRRITIPADERKAYQDCLMKAISLGVAEFPRGFGSGL